MKRIYFFVLVSYFSCMGVSAGQGLVSNITPKNFAVKLGATRIIYNEGSSGQSLVVMNPQDYPMLVQSSILGEDKRSLASFIVSPPLFRLEGNQQSRIRTIWTEDAHPNNDREMLNWLCIKAVPPVDNYKNNTGVAFNLMVSTCIKLFYRPKSISGSPEDVAGELSWKLKGKEITINNPTPFYMNIASASVGGKLLRNIDYIPPFTSKEIKSPDGAIGNVEWKVTTDYGGESKTFKTTLK
ncbi:fimbria/pilus periplasmic chaperone [Yersinia rochesterensis]|uniref:fimbria/pilus periplasmic chaperone n=1 Tax=Yersinia TaxID=629 RepID=UPI002240B383|nr:MULTISPECIES: fimbria/pilus periplasmic chaperone [Yersinia]MDA5543797.1 fimbria/pilus periplasmic chaperone [Yersinia rochesterensis]UZM74493.1 fimbria/pilus periplasmic chaperone [Yersinia sp. SCPM-O-B-9106 (C-191)]